MQIDTTKETLCINKIVGKKSEIIMVERDIIVPDIKPDLLNIINTTGNVCIYKKEVLEGKVRLDGEVNVYVMYIADNEESSLRGLSTSIDFTEIIDFDNCNENMSLDENLFIKSLECKILNGRKMNIKANLQFDGTIYSNETVEIIKEINNLDDIQSLETELVVNSLVGEGTQKTSAKDTIMIENIDNLAEILKVDLSITNKDLKISYNKVLGKADVSVKIMYLTEDNGVKVVESKIPIMGFVDIENVSEENICDMKYKLKNVIIKPSPQEEHSIYVEVELELVCRAYENKNIRIIQDLYSPSESLTFEPKCINTMSQKKCIKDMCKIQQKISASDISTNQIYDVEITPNILEQKIANSKVMLEGEINLKFIYALNRGVSIKEVKLPFEHSIETENIDLSANIETNIEIASNNFVVGTDEMIDAKIDLVFSLDVLVNTTINMIDKINVDETRSKEIYSIIIYFVKPGDTLWKIAKEFRSTVDDIARVNKIEDKDKISSGQQLFIPKYVYTKRKVSA